MGASLEEDPVRLTDLRLMRGAGALLILAGVSTAVFAQAPAPRPGGAGPPHEEKYTNLKILPEDIKPEALHGVMRNFSSALGVRCNFCHVGNSPQSMEWAKDDKDEKKSARVMMKMTMGINKDVLPQLESMSDHAEVSCYTCHHGSKEPPRKLSDVLADTAKASGADAAAAQYKKMKDESLEAGQYDFRAPMVVAAAMRLNDDQKPDEAIGLLKAGAALFPQSADVAASLGMALAQKGDKAAAETELNRALSLDPNNFMAKGALERLKGEPPKP